MATLLHQRCARPRLLHLAGQDVYATCAAQHSMPQHGMAQRSTALTLRDGLQLSVVCVAVRGVRQVHRFVARLLRRQKCRLLPLLRLLCCLLRLLLCCRLRRGLRLRLVRPKMRQQHAEGAERVAQAADEAAAGQISFTPAL